LHLLYKIINNIYNIATNPGYNIPHSSTCIKSGSTQYNSSILILTGSIALCLYSVHRRLIELIVLIHIFLIPDSSFL